MKTAETNEQVLSISLSAVRQDVLKTGDVSILFDFTLSDASGNAVIALYGVRCVKGYLNPPARPMGGPRGRYCATAGIGSMLYQALSDELAVHPVYLAATAAGMPKLLPVTEHPTYRTAVLY
jgi:hypothetical protein